MRVLISHSTWQLWKPFPSFRSELWPVRHQMPPQSHVTVPALQTMSGSKHSVAEGTSVISKCGYSLCQYKSRMCKVCDWICQQTPAAYELCSFSVVRKDAITATTAVSSANCIHHWSHLGSYSCKAWKVNSQAGGLWWLSWEYYLWSPEKCKSKSSGALRGMGQN